MKKKIHTSVTACFRFFQEVFNWHNKKQINVVTLFFNWIEPTTLHTRSIYTVINIQPNRQTQFESMESPSMRQKFSPFLP